MVEYNVKLEDKTVLVTGAAGFIGSNLVKRLFHDVKDIKVFGIDSITDYYDVNIKYERLKEIEALGRDWTFVHASIADKEAVEKIFTRNNISVVVKFFELFNGLCHYLLDKFFMLTLNDFFNSVVEVLCFGSNVLTCKTSCKNCNLRMSDTCGTS